MEIILMIVFWFIAIVSLFAMPALLIVLLSKIIRNKPARIISVLLVAVLTISAITVTAIRPPITVAENVYGEISTENMEIVKRMGSGFYTKYVPFLSVRKVITSASDRGVTFTTYYFPFGSTALSCTDGVFNSEKSLFGR